MSWWAVGVGIPRVAADQFEADPHVPLSRLLAGDLVFWATKPTEASTIYHVAMYVGGGRIVQAPYPGQVVSTTWLGGTGLVAQAAAPETWRAPPPAARPPPGRRAAELPIRPAQPVRLVRLVQPVKQVQAGPPVQPGRRWSGAPPTPGAQLAPRAQSAGYRYALSSLPACSVIVVKWPAETPPRVIVAGTLVTGPVAQFGLQLSSVQTPWPTALCGPHDDQWMWSTMLLESTL
jgi:hypothetical protein